MRPSLTHTSDSVAKEIADLRLLQEISTRLINEGDLASLYHHVAEAAAALMNSEMASLQWYDAGREQLHLLASKGFHPECAALWEWVDVKSGTTCGKALRSGKRFMVEDLELFDPIKGKLDCAPLQKCGIRALQSTPALSRTGKIIGMISTHWTKPHPFDHQEFANFDVLARLAADLIERAITEEALRRKEMLMQMALVSGRAYSWDFDISTREMRITGKPERVLGFSLPTDLNSMLKIVHPDDRLSLPDAFARAVNEGCDVSVEFRVISPKTKRVHWMHGQGTTLRDAKNRPTRIIGITQDITRRKLKEANVEFVSEITYELSRFSTRDEILEAACKKIGSYLGLSGLQLCEVSEDGEHVAVNHAWAKYGSRPITGVFPLRNFISDEVVQAYQEGRTVVIADAKRFSPEKAAAFQHLRVAALVGIPFHQNGEWRYCISMTDDKPREWPDEEVELMRELANRLFPRLERAIAEEALRASNIELARLNKNLEAFNYVASHDLQSPLKKIMAYCDLLKLQLTAPLNEDAETSLTRIQNAAKKAIELMASLLKYSKITSMNDDIVEVDMNAVVDDALADLEIQVKEKKAVVKKEVLPVIKARRLQMQQLVANLMGNALKYCGQKPPLIQISASQEKNAWVFRMKDNGAGIPPVFSKKIFELFQRGAHPGNEGTGVGLTICRKIVESHGGEIWANSLPNKGSTFYFTLPVH